MVNNNIFYSQISYILIRPEAGISVDAGESIPIVDLIEDNCSATTIMENQDISLTTTTTITINNQITNENVETGENKYDQIVLDDEINNLSQVTFKMTNINNAAHSINATLSLPYKWSKKQQARIMSLNGFFGMINRKQYRIAFGNTDQEQWKNLKWSILKGDNETDLILEEKNSYGVLGLGFFLKINCQKDIDCKFRLVKENNIYESKQFRVFSKQEIMEAYFSRQPSSDLALMSNITETKKHPHFSKYTPHEVPSKRDAKSQILILNEEAAVKLILNETSESDESISLASHPKNSSEMEVETDTETEELTETLTVLHAAKKAKT